MLERFDTIWGTFWSNDLVPVGECSRCGKILWMGFAGNMWWDREGRRVYVCYPCLRPEED